VRSVTFTCIAGFEWPITLLNLWFCIHIFCVCAYTFDGVLLLPFLLKA
jgi:hypothetical protein